MDWTDVRSRLEPLATDELLAILRAHDEDEWQPEVFDIVRGLLAARGVDVEAALRSGRAPEAAAPPGALEIVATFGTVTQADPCRTGLVGAGFDVFLVDENTVAIDPALWPALRGVKIAVPGEQAADAREYLAATERGELAAGPEVAIPCDRCGSANVRFVSRTDRSATVMNVLLAGVVVADHDGHYECGDCGAVVS